MELPRKLLDQYRIPLSKPKVERKVESKPLYKTFNVMLTFDTGERLRAELTAKNKPYWTGQLEADIKQTWNSDRRHVHKVISVRVFRNATDGGVLIHGDRVINVH